MQTKLILGGVAVILIIIAFIASRPAEVVAPMNDGTTPPTVTENTSTAPEVIPSETVTVSPEVTTPSESAPKPAPTPKPAPAPTYPTSATVVYDGDRFIPDSVTIVEGGTVRFMNTSSDQKMWVGSDNHPSHTRYPEKTDGDCLGSSFDQCTASAPGSSWSFTFGRTGTWGYHNHVRAQDNGRVIVMTREEYLKTQ